MKFFIHTFGCQMNESDSEHITGILIHAGAIRTHSPEESDIIIINTCAVRGKTEEKLFSLLGRMASLKKQKDIRVGVVGCIAQLYGADLMKKSPGIDFILGPDTYSRLPQFLEESLGEKFISTEWSREWHGLNSDAVIRENKVSAYVPVMEGCNNYCSYCIVPFTRGREKFRPLPSILAELRGIADDGYKEVQLLGQNVNSYEDPKTGRPFPELLREASSIRDIEWVRFITSHPKNFSEDIARTMAESGKICRQLHLPVQSGSTSVLSRMNRGYTQKEYMDKIALLRELMPDISLSTDIIVGFPGETEKEFRETLRLLEKVRFTNIFSFRYSPRPLTQASQLRDSVPFEEKRNRLMEVQTFQKKIQMEDNRVRIGQVMKVLCTGRSKKSPDIFSGRNEGHQVVNFSSPEMAQEKFVEVLITGCGPYSLRGEFRRFL